jgi:xanthine dehydrogenase YagT iron-sulfur-binding subunit
MTPQSAAAARLGQTLPNRELLSYNVTLRIDQRAHALTIDPRTTLLDAIRDHVGLTGTKKGCGHGRRILSRSIGA